MELYEYPLEDIFCWISSPLFSLIFFSQNKAYGKLFDFAPSYDNKVEKFMHKMSFPGQVVVVEKNLKCLQNIPKFKWLLATLEV